MQYITTGSLALWRINWKCLTVGLSFCPLAQLDLRVALLAVLKRCTGLADLLLEIVALRLSTNDLSLPQFFGSFSFGFESPRHILYIYIDHIEEFHLGIGWQQRPALMSRWEEPTAGQTCTSWNQQNGQLLEYFIHKSWILSSRHR